MNSRAITYLVDTIMTDYTRFHIFNIYGYGDNPSYTAPDGSQYWYKFDVELGGNVLHRDHDLPAVMKANGTMKWYRDGLLHRDGDKHAVYKIGHMYAWYVDGVPHRERDKPAIVYVEAGTYVWMIKGELHREGGAPAIQRTDGSKEWFNHGVRHRLNGPALITADGAAEWYVNGVRRRNYVSKSAAAWRGKGKRMPTGARGRASAKK